MTGNQRDGALYAPTVLDKVRPEMTLVREETVGPCRPSSPSAAIQISNGTAFGLSSGICTNRMDDAMRFATELKVGVNMWEVHGYRQRGHGGR